MVEVSKDLFTDVISKIDYTISFLFGEEQTIRYNAKKGFYKGFCFAKRIKDKYYVNKRFI